MFQEPKVNGHSEPAAVPSSSSTVAAEAKKSNQKEKASTDASSSNHSSNSSTSSSSQTSSNQNGARGGESSPALPARAAGIPVLPNGVVQSKDQLAYLAKVLGVTVTYQDFPKKNNKSEFFSLVSLSTDPPQVYFPFYT